MNFLRQATASQSRLIGPFVDDTDFKTPETALTILNTDIKLRANGTSLSNKNSGGATHQVNGTYSVTWDATDTANVGELFYSVLVAGALVVFGMYTVLEEAVYDGLFGAAATGYLQPTVAGRTLDVSATGEAGVDWANVGTPGSTVALTGTTINTTALAPAVLDEVVEGTTTLRQSMRLANSANAGKVAGAGTVNVTIRDLADTKNRIDAVVDANGNRTSVTRDVS